MHPTTTMAGRKEIPLFGICMKRALLTPSQICSIVLDETFETLAILRSQEAAYRCKNVLGTGLRPAGRGLESRHDDPYQMIDTKCREGMCEWCYKVCDCDQFPCTREMVAVTFSYVDRFLERRLCDRSSFKLAVITSFYIATKVQCSAQISISSLAALSRGEFNCNDIIGMERVLLEALEWRMHPPTVQVFISQLRMIFSPTVHAAVIEAIYQQAVFFAEVCVFDPFFISMDRYLVAVACLLNAMETLDEKLDCQEKATLWTVGAIMRVDQSRKALEMAQARLWYLYSCSAQAYLDTDIVPRAYSEKHAFQIHEKRKVTSGGQSPVCVRLHG